MKLTPQEELPVPPPVMQVSQKARERREARKEADSETTTEIEGGIKQVRQQTRQRTDSQSSTLSVGSTGVMRQITTRDLAITLIVADTEHHKNMFARTLTPQDKQEIIKAVLKGHAKIQWNSPTLKKEQIVTGFSRGIIGAEKIKFRMVSSKDYWKIKETSIQSKQWQ